MFEWNLYVPAVGETIQSLPFSTLGKDAVSCLTMGHDVNVMVANQETMHQRLTRHGVRSILLSNRNYAFSPYNKVVSAGAEVIAHRTLPEALVQLKDILTGPCDKALINLYWAGLDSAAHTFGPNSPVHEAEVTSFWLTLDTLLGQLQSKDTMLLITADHGQVGARAEDTVYINEVYPELQHCLARSQQGRTILPNGSPRDMFLHVESDHRANALNILQEGLSDIAAVLTVDDAIDEGLFGEGSIDPERRCRLGDILVLPYAGHFIWWREDGVMDNRLHGHHGGLAGEELITVAGVLDSL